MSDGIIICLIICGTVSAIAGALFYFIWRDNAGLDMVIKAENYWKVDDFNRKKREALVQIEGSK